MKDEQNQAQSKAYRGYDTPGEDKIIKSSSDAVPSPNATSKQRLETPDDYIGGEVNERPGDANPALNETISYERGEESTADFLRARESAEEQRSRKRGSEIYADQSTDEDDIGNAAYDATPDHNIEEAIREYGEPSEVPEEDLLGLRGPHVAPEESDGH